MATDMSGPLSAAVWYACPDRPEGTGGKPHMSDYRTALVWIRQAIAARSASDPTLVADIDERAYYALSGADPLDHGGQLADVIPLRRNAAPLISFDQLADLLGTDAAERIADCERVGGTSEIRMYDGDCRQTVFHVTKHAGGLFMVQRIESLNGPLQ